MVNLYACFILWNNIDEARNLDLFLFGILAVISASAGILFMQKTLNDINNNKDLYSILTILCLTSLTFCLIKIIILWNNINETRDIKLFLFGFLAVISTNTGIFFLQKSLNDLNDKKSLSIILATLCLIGLIFCLIKIKTLMI